MAKMIAYCGIDCVECPAFQATLKDDAEAWAKVAREWSTPEYELKLEDVNCDGCSSHRCDMLKASHSRSPKAYEVLEELRQSTK